MDRVAALADIVPPVAPPAVPPAGWWLLPWFGIALLAALVLWAGIWRRRSRPWRRLRIAARRARRDEGDADAAARAVELAAALRCALPEADWPQGLRRRLDDLRYAPATEAQSRRDLRALGAQLEPAAARAAAAAAVSSRRARSAFTRRCSAAAGGGDGA